jgi:large conductance mechanosensitive channel
LSKALVLATERHPKEAFMFREFIAFLKFYGVIGLAIAVVIGGKANELVSSLVNDLLMPLLFQPALRAAQVEDIRKLSYNGILYGKVVGTTIDFLIVAFVVFLFAKYVLKEAQVAKK